MDPDDFDQTQAIVLDDQDYNDDTDELAPDGDKKPVSFLKVPLQKGINETTYPLYDGDNIIGRNQDTCHVHIPSKSLSKEHACIQIVGDVHMIFDKGSRNKTRRGKLFLSPEVRYELKNNEEIMFADVNCIYQIADEFKVVAESGSETEGSESLMLKYDVTDETSAEAAQLKGKISEADSENNNDDSVLPPTQSYPAEHSKAKVIVKETPESTKTGSRILDTDVPLPTLVLSESESDDEEEETRNAKSKNIHKTAPEIQDTLLCEDSDPESSRDKYQFAAATQAYGIGEEDESSRNSLIGAATQAYRPIKDDSDEEGETDKSLMNEPTQAFRKSDRISEDLSETAGTQSFRVDGKALVEGNQDNKSKELNASDSSAAATQVFEEEEDDFGGECLFAAATMACDDVVEEEDETDDEDRVGESNLLGPDAPTQVFDAEAPTQKVVANQNEQGNSDTVIIGGKLSKERKEIQADTLVVSGSCDAETMPIPSSDNKPSRGRSQGARAQGGTCTADLPTQVIADEGDTLQIGGAERDPKQDIEDNTQVFGETIAVEDIDAGKKSRKPVRNVKGKKANEKPVNETELETMPVQDASTLSAHWKQSLPKGTTASAKKLKAKEDLASDTLVIGDDDNGEDGVNDPTQLFDAAIEQKTIPEGKKDADGDVDEPTQDYANSSGDLPTQVFSPAESPVKGKKKRTAATRKHAASKEKRISQAISSEDDDDEASEKPWMSAAANEPTQAYSNTSDIEEDSEGSRKKLVTSERSTINRGKKNTMAISSDEDDEDQQLRNAANGDEPTQAYSACDDEGEAVVTEEPTQAYCLVGDDSDKEDDDEVKKGVLCEEATQAYGLGPVDEQDDDVDADATQPFDNDVEDNGDDVIKKNVQNDPTQTYDMALGKGAPMSHQQGKSAEAVEDSEDDSDLEATSVLQMDQVAEALAESHQLSPNVTDVKETTEGTSNNTREAQKSIPGALSKQTRIQAKDAEPLSDLSDPPLSPVIPDKSNESTPVFAISMGEKQLSDTEEMVPDSMANSDGEEKAETETEPIIPLPLPARSPLKSALVDRKRSPSPARKRVNFTEPQLPTTDEKGEKEANESSVGRGRRGQKAVKADAGGRLTRNTHSESRKELSGTEEDETEEREAHECKRNISKDETKTKGSRTEGIPNDEQEVKNEISLTISPPKYTKPEQAEASSKSAENKDKVEKELPPRSSRGRKRKVDETQEKASVSTNSSKNIKLQEAIGNQTKNQSAEPIEGLETKEKNKPLGKCSPPNKDLSTAKQDEQVEGKNRTNKEESHPVRRSKAATTKGQKIGLEQESVTSSPEGRMSSRGRRITTSNHLKDFDTSTNQKGRVSRSSLLSSSPVVNEKSPASDKTISDSGQQHITANTQVAESAAQKAQPDILQTKEKTDGVADQPAVSASLTEVTRRGKRGRPSKNLKKAADSSQVIAVDTSNEESTENTGSKDIDNEVKVKTSRRGGIIRKTGKQSEDDQGSPAESECVGDTKNDGSLTGGNRGAVKSSPKETKDIKSEGSDTSEIRGMSKSSPKKTRGQLSAVVTDVKEDNAKDETVDDDSNVRVSFQKDDEKKNEVGTQRTTTQNKRGRKSTLKSENNANLKQAKNSNEVEGIEKNEGADKQAEVGESGKGGKRLRAAEKANEQHEQSLSPSETNKGTIVPKAGKSRRGRPPSRAATASKAGEDLVPGPESLPSDPVSNSEGLETAGRGKSLRRGKNQNASDVHENEDVSKITASARGGAKGRRSIMATAKVAEVEQENKSISDVQLNESEPSLRSSTRGSSRQRSKAPVAGSDESVEPEQMDVTATEAPDQSSQSSVSSRGRRGAKRSAMSHESQAEEGNQTSSKSSGKESVHSPLVNKQAGRNSKKVNVEQEKEAKVADSQPSPSPAKRSRKSSPPPSTPSRKSTALTASPVSSPSLRKSTLNSQPKVMFTGVIDDQGEKIVKDLGGEMASNIQDCTHLITDKIRRTVKFLGGLAKGALIVTPQWLESSKRAKTFLDGSKFLVSDPSMEKQYRFSLQSSIERASSSRLLQGYSLHVTPSVRPDPSQMKDILHCAGAKYLNTMPTKSLSQTLVISCPEDESLWSAAAKAGVPVVGAEFVLTGLLRQELQPQVFSLIKADESQTSKGRGRHK